MSRYARTRSILERRAFVRSALAAAAVAAWPVRRPGAQAGAVQSGVAQAGVAQAGAAQAGAVQAGVDAVGLGGQQLTLAASDVTDFASRLRGPLLLSADPDYDSARKTWNGSFDRRPALIARCTGAADVVLAVNFARSHQLLTAVRGGGHSISGQSSCDGGLVIDLSPMKGIRVDPVARTVQAQPGVLLGEIDRETQAFGLATTFGTASTTGIAGLTLGGGLGRLARKFGLTCDNLLSVDIVTADGKLLRASERENTDLFWAVRGGGGNFGVVTAFEYRLHPLGPQVLAGVVMFPIAQAKRALSAAAEFSEGAPDEMYLNPLFASSPDGRVAGFEFCYCGELKEGERLIAPLRKAGTPVFEEVLALPYLELQRSIDPMMRAGRSYYFKSGFMPPVVNKTIDDLVPALAGAPDWLTGVPLIHMGGAISRVKPEATAFWNRGARHDLAIWASWEGREENEKHISAVRTFWRSVEHLTKGYYINTDVPDDERRLRETYGGNYDRLVQIKTKYDPMNLFRLNANIRPAAAG